MISHRRFGAIARLLCATSIGGGAILIATPAEARCLTSGTSLTCDTTAPNPDAVTTVLAADTVTVAPNAGLSGSAASTLSPAGTTVGITNNGQILNSNATGRAINFAGANNSRTIQITNNAGAVIQSADDAVRVNFNPTGGTIRVDNAGTIRTTNGGQAIDFDTAASGSGQIIINNLATGQLLSVGQDAIRPGQGAVVTNAGLIRSDGAANNSFDGVDWQGKSGVVNNLATGTISGLRHGITSDVAVTVTNAGTITGRNGSGVGSDGTGMVVNTGTITGQWDGVATNGDGDGVDIDLIGTVVNSGTIQGLTATGVDSGGRPNSAEGVAMGGGSITNNLNATIFGGARGILVNLDTNPGGAAVGATTIVNAGIIRGGTGEGIQLVGDFADSITNSGLISGGNGVAIDMGGGNDSLILTGGASFVGRVDGGAGTDTITLGATNAVGNALTGAVNFEALVVTGTGWRLAQPANFANGISIAASGSLAGNAAAFAGSIANAGELIVDQSGDGSFTGTLTGNGSLLKTGVGTLTIGSQTGFTGATTIGQGRLLLAGSLPGVVFVTNGATLGGIGAVGATNLSSGSIIAPGNSIGTIAVNGGFTAQAGSTYLAETTAAGTSDLIAVSGGATIGSGARLAVIRDTGTYSVGRRYTLLTATGGIAGTYTLLQDANALTEFRLGGTAGSVFVDVARTAGSLAGVAQTRNQLGVASALASLGVANGAYAALTLNPSDEAVRAGFDSLSGEIHATVITTMVKDAQAAEAAALGRLTTVSGNGLGVWAEGLYRTGTDTGRAGGAGRLRSDTGGGVGGIDMGIGDWARIGIAGGYTHTKLHVESRSSTARSESAHLLGYASGSFGALTVKGVIGYAWTSIDTHRSVAFAGFASELGAAYDGSVLHGTIDAGYKLPFGAGTVEPFAAIEGYRVKRDGFAEPGAGAALTSGGRSEQFAISTLGARAETPVVARFSARGQLGWRHAFDTLSPSSLMRFTTGAVPFRVRGAPLAENAAAASIELDWRPTERVTLSGGYAGIIGGVTDESRFQLRLGIGF